MADRGPRVIVPSEHGAWGQLFMPLVTALGAGSPGVLAMLAAAAVILAFLSTEGLRVLQGERGPRARRERHGAAVRSVGAFGGGAVVVVLALVVIGGTGQAGTFIVPTVMAAAVGATMWTGRIKSTAGELLVAGALTAAAIPVGRAAGLDAGTTASHWAVWTAAFGGATLAVRGLIASQTGRGGAIERWVALVVVWSTAAALLLLAGAGQGSLLVALGFLPTAAIASVASLRLVDVRRLRTVGWSLVGASAVLALALIVTARFER